MRGAWVCSHPPATDCGPGAARPSHGRVHAIEHPRLILGEHKIADVRSPVTLIFGEEFQGYAEFTPRSLQEQRVTATLDELTAWSSAITTLRQPTADDTRQTAGSSAQWLSSGSPSASVVTVTAPRPAKWAGSTVALARAAAVRTARRLRRA